MDATIKPEVLLRGVYKTDIIVSYDKSYNKKKNDP